MIKKIYILLKNKNNMILKSLELLHIRLPFRNHFQTSFGKFYDRDLLILKGISNKGVVYGEAPALAGPFYSPETTLTTIHVIKDFISKRILNVNFKNIDEVHNAMKFIKGNPIAKSGIDNLFYHIKALEENKSLTELIGGKREFIESGISIGIQDSIEDLLEKIQESLDLGFKRIKIKIKKGYDIEVVRKVREAFPDIALMVDANSDYTLDDVNILKQLDQFNLIMIEQPLDDEDIIDHAILQKQIKTSICLDESIHSYEDAKKAISIGACKIINIKLARVGGLLPAIKIHDLCLKNKIPIWCGGMLESGIGQAFAIALTSLPGFILPGDVAPSDRYFVEDIIRPPIIIKNGRINVPKKAGLGFEVDEKKIEEYLVERIRV